MTRRLGTHLRLTTLSWCWIFFLLLSLGRQHEVGDCTAPTFSVCLLRNIGIYWTHTVHSSWAQGFACMILRNLQMSCLQNVDRSRNGCHFLLLRWWNSLAETTLGRKGWFWLTVQGYRPSWLGSHSSSSLRASGHMTSGDKKWRVTDAHSILSPIYALQDTAQERVPSSFRVGFLFLINLIETIPHRHHPWLT